MKKEREGRNGILGSRQWSILQCYEHPDTHPAPPSQISSWMPVFSSLPSLSSPLLSPTAEGKDQGEKVHSKRPG